MRLAGAIWAVAIVLVALVMAFQIHQRRTWVANPTQVCAGQAFPSCARQHPSWEDPVAAIIVLGGIAAGGHILISARRPA